MSQPLSQFLTDQTLPWRSINYHIHPSKCKVSLTFEGHFAREISCAYLGAHRHTLYGAISGYLRAHNSSPKCLFSLSPEQERSGRANITSNSSLKGISSSSYFFLLVLIYCLTHLKNCTQPDIYSSFYCGFLFVMSSSTDY